MASPLTGGAVERILNGETVDKPVLQVLNFKPIAGNTTDRYRLLLSDGVKCHTYAMLGTQLNSKIIDKEIERFAVVQLDKYMCNTISPEKKILIILELTVIANGADVGSKLGNPVMPSSTGAAAPSDGDGASNRTPASSEFAASVKPPGGAQFPTRNTQPAPMQSSFRSNGGPTSGGDVVVLPICSLTPYQNKWTIRARVTNKSAIRTWNNARGEGKLFSMDLLDESGEIRATAFNAECDRFYDLVEVNKVYYISRANLKTANPKFSSLKNEFEMSFTQETAMTPCEEAAPHIPTLQFNFVPIRRLQEIGPDKVVDVIGVCKDAGTVQTVVRRANNQELKKRDVSLVDKSSAEVSLTLWGDQAEAFDGSNNPVIAVKGVRVSDFSGVSLSMIGSSQLQVNPDIPESHALIGWYSNEGASLQTQSLSVRTGGFEGAAASWKHLSEAKSQKLGFGDKPDYFSCKASVAIVRKENCLYKACPAEKCNKKLVNLENGLYRCEKCNEQTSEFKWRLIVSAHLCDFSAGQWVTCFGAEAEQLLGNTAAELGGFFEGDHERFEEAVNDAAFRTFIFKLRTKMETYNDESRLKTSVVSINPVNYVDYTKKLLKDIAEFEKVL
ncbi:replication protein A 70 kDa DNA-binding subunit [Ixodes scapularis]|nr:replication protein A 70 kDa DNA-binding subunit [Ixodes scapularis]